MQEFPSNLRLYLRTFRRKAILIVSFTSVTTLVAMVLSFRDPNTYVTSFRLLLEPISSAAKLSQASTLARTKGLPDEDLLSLDYPTQMEVLKSSIMLSNIAERVKAKCPGINVAAIKQDLRENLIVERIKVGPSRYDSTKIFEVTYKGIDAKVVQAVAEATAEQFLNYSLEERQNGIRAGVKFIDEQLPELEQRVTTLRSQQQKLQQQYNLINPIERGQELFAQVRELTEQKLKAQTQLQELKTLSTNLQKHLSLTPEEAVVTLALNQEPGHKELLTQLQKIENQIAIESAHFTTNSPNLRVLKEERENLLTLLKQKTKPILEKHSISVDNNSPVLNFHSESRLDLIQQLVDTSNEIQVLKVRNQSLTATKKTFVKPAQQFPEIVRQYKELDRQLELTTRILDQLLIQRETLRVEGAQKDVPWKLLSKPQIPLDAEGKPLAFPPNRTKKLLAGAMGGMVLGMSAARLLEKRRDIFYTAEDIQDMLLIPLLGEIPVDDRFKALLNVNPDSNALALLETQCSDVRESLFLNAFNSVYAELTFLYAENPVRSLIVSSVESKDGQSTVALELAKTAAVKDKRVLLVDANLNQPQLHSRLNLPNSGGLDNLLTHKLAPEEFIRRVPEVDNLFILTAGSFLSDYPKQLWSSQMKHLMEDLSLKYDLVIYDPPHFLDSPDVSFLTANTDGILMVVGLNKTRQSLVKQAINQINTFRLPTLGVVANHLF